MRRHLQGSQQSIPGVCAETGTGSDSAGALRRYSSLRWNYHIALLVPCSPSRRVRFAAMRIYEMGSNHRLIPRLRRQVKLRSAAP